jgi:multidrug efflux pump subunit AcrB
VIGGVTLTTFLTLLVIPVVYSVMDRKTYAATDSPGTRVDGNLSMLHTSTALQRPVTTAMTFIALVLVGLIALHCCRSKSFPTSRSRACR